MDNASQRFVNRYVTILETGIGIFYFSQSKHNPKHRTHRYQLLFSTTNYQLPFIKINPIMKKISFILSTMLLMLCLFVSTNEAQAQTDLLKKAYDAYENNKYDEAVKLFSEVLNKDDKNYEALLVRGLAYSYLNDNKAAMTDYNKAISIKAADFYAYMLRAKANFPLEAYKEVITDCSKVLTMKEGEKYHKHAYYLRGKAYLKLEKHQEALNDFEEALKIDPKYEQAEIYRDIVKDIIDRPVNPRPRPRPITPTPAPRPNKPDPKPNNYNQFMDINWKAPVASPVESKTASYTIKAMLVSKSEISDVKVLVNGTAQVNKGNAVRKVRTQDKQSFDRNLEVDIKLVAGNNEVQIVAVNKEGTSLSMEKTIVYNSPTNTNVERPNLYILSVGVAKYADENFMQLQYPAKDAKDFANAFLDQEKMPQNRQLYNKVETIILTDETATRKKIAEAVVDLKGKASANDLVILFFSMHGDKDGMSDFYFMTHDAEANPDLYATSALHNIWLANHINEFDATVVQFIDACHSGQAGKEYARKSLPLNIERHVDDLNNALDPSSRYIFASSRGSQFSQERSSWENGAFTEAIIDCFNNKTHTDTDGNTIQSDSDGNQVIDTNELSKYVSKTVRLITDGQQSPKATIIDGEPLNLYIFE